MKRNFLLTIEYDGTGFFGWQRQPDCPTVQGNIEEALYAVFGQEIQINGTGRTDAGVHAYGQRANFTGDLPLPTDKLALVLNHKLAEKRNSPGAIRIIRAEEKPLDFHARFDATGKKYLYKIATENPPDLFRRNYYYQLPGPLNVDAMKEAAKFIVGTRDFSCFQASGGEEKETTVRTVFSLDVQHENGDIILQIKGDGFLYNMVRIIAGTLVETGQGKRTPAQLAEVINGKDRAKAGHTAPPQGLYLAEVYFEEPEGVKSHGSTKDGTT